MWRHVWQVRATSKAFSRVQTVDGSETFLRESGWRSRTVDFKPFWVYEHRPATLQWGWAPSPMSRDVATATRHGS